jgi:hypothetical protein
MTKKFHSSFLNVNFDYYYYYYKVVEGTHWISLKHYRFFVYFLLGISSASDKFCRRFGALCQLHLQRLDEANRGFRKSAKLNLTPGKYPKENIQDSEHGENLKTRTLSLYPESDVVMTYNP